MKGYYRQPELTRQVIQNGWLKTGDLGQIDQQGNLFISGRIKGLIITGGKNVCPEEIEECILGYPVVSEVCVVGKSDKLLGEVPFAFIVKKTNTKITVTDVVSFCRQKLSNYKVPYLCKFIDTLPKLANGKVDRNRLRQIVK